MRRRHDRRSWTLGVLIAALLAGACSPAGDTSASSGPRAAPVPPPAPVVEIAMADHHFDYYPGAIPAGRVVFRARNVGEDTHNLIMLPLAEDVPPIDEQLRGSERRLVEPFAGFYDRQPGDTGTFAVDLEPGRRYAMICSVTGPDGEPHWSKGMATEFRTPGGDQ